MKCQCPCGCDSEAEFMEDLCWFCLEYHEEYRRDEEENQRVRAGER